jgi:hypothetical protein
MEPYCPGVSLVAGPGSGVVSGELRRELRDLDPYDVRVAYDGSDDPAAPGWRYLNLVRPLVPGAFIWFTELDEPRPDRSPPQEHPNGVERVAALVFDLPSARLGRLADLSRDIVSDGAFTVDDVEILSADTPHRVPSAGRKRFPLTAVVLEARSLDIFVGARDVLEIDLGSDPAVLVETNPSCWDLVIRSGSRGS